ncbi:MAG: hypothetical protein QXZ09_10425, partial [Candidatus Methanomethylicaceae archaeon]
RTVESPYRRYFMGEGKTVYDPIIRRRDMIESVYKELFEEEKQTTRKTTVENREKNKKDIDIIPLEEGPKVLR